MLNLQKIYKIFTSNPLWSRSREKLDPTTSLSEEISMLIFSYLKPKDLGRSCLVNKQWRRLASDSTLWNAFNLREIFPSLKVFDEIDWASHIDLSSFGLDVTDAPPLDKRTAISFINRSLSLPIERNAGVTLLTIPKGVTYNILVKVAGSPKMGNITQFKDIPDCIPNEIGDIPVDKTYRIVITNSIFKNSRNLSVSAQEALVSKIGCDMPKILEAMVLLIMTFMSSGKYLYSHLDFTRCSDQVCGYRLKVGFSSDYLYVYPYYSIHSSLGVGGVFRKF